MKIVLGRKQKYNSDEPWNDAIAHIEELVSREEVEDWANKAVKRIENATVAKNAAFAWSGGKDSLVLADLCKRAGVDKCCLFLTKLEFPEFEAWLLKNKPEGCDVIRRDFDLEFLKAHPNLIFPKGKDMQQWNIIMQRGSQLAYYHRDKLDILLTGHRKIDGNTCGKDGFTIRKSGETIYAPIWDWPHEVLFGYIHYNGIQLPPIYKWPRAFRNGTHFWPYRNCETHQQGWEEIYQIDPDLVRTIAQTIPEAEEFLKGVKA